MEGTCTTKGYTIYTCTLCGDTYTDNYTEVNGHKFGEILLEPTCTHRGYTIHYCEDCGYEYSDSYVPATGHAYEAEEHPVTCTENGYTLYTCKNCGETRTEETPELDKTYHIKEVVAPTCPTEGNTINECNEVPGLTYKGDYKAKLPHAYDAGKVTKPATIYEKGTKTFTCTSCGATYTEDIPVVEKTWHKGTTVEPTCTEKGYTIYICDQDSALTEKRDYTNALGHAWDTGTVTTAATCTTARSVSASAPTSLPGRLRPSERETMSSLAPSTTWLFVTM